MMTLFIDLQGFYDGIRWQRVLGQGLDQGFPAPAPKRFGDRFCWCPKKARVRVLRTSPFAAAMYGHEAQGIAPKRLKAEAIIRCALAHGPEGRTLMLQAWRPLWQRQSQTRYGWQKVSGPLQYLQDLDVDAQDPLCWKWEDQTLELSTDDPCLQGKVRAFMAQVVAAWRTRRFSKAQSAAGAEGGVDWAVARMLPKRYVQATATHHIHRDGIFAEESPIWGQFVYATNASGGRYTRDHRLRNVGWAVIAATWGPQGLQKVGTLSGVLMPSAVSAGESEAIIALLKLVNEEVDITTDSRVAVRHLKSENFTKSMYLSWGQVWDSRHLGRTTWIRSHTTHDGFVQEFGEQSIWRRTLNAWADQEADRRANEAQPLSRAVKIQYLDRAVAHVIHHLAQRVEAAMDHTDKALVKKTIAKRRQQAQAQVKAFNTNFTMKCKAVCGNVAAVVARAHQALPESQAGSVDQTETSSQVSGSPRPQGQGAVQQTLKGKKCLQGWTHGVHQVDFVKIAWPNKERGVCFLAFWQRAEVLSAKQQGTSPTERSKQWCACACGYGWAWHQQVASGEDTHCAICGRSWAKQIAKKKKEKEARAEQRSWVVPGWPTWAGPKGRGNKGQKAELGKVSSALADVWQDLSDVTQKALARAGCKPPRFHDTAVPGCSHGVYDSGAGDHVQKLLAAARIPPPGDENLEPIEVTLGQRLTWVVTEFRKSTNQMQKLVKKRALLQARAHSLQEELEALMMDVAQVGREIETKDAEMQDTAREFKELTEGKATTAYGQLEQVLKDAGHDLAEGTKAKLKAALLTKAAEDEICPDPF
ncbi:unnamed protein product [Symbiodinium necroappetens]|uniref:RNase H type-1 domain-containing protein n=1 Tax=Symbiodinium necroappetens TaxID=1628268 RepID=A0A813CD20_9DINO|nr:unnamed protein product [Symbiodinium necroappetens]